jgi:hypothetical protein
MSASAARLRDRLAQVGKVKRDTLAEETRHFLSLDPGARLAATLQHCDAHIAAFGTGLDEAAAMEAEAETWARVRRRLTAGCAHR